MVFADDVQTDQIGAWLVVLVVTIGTGVLVVVVVGTDDQTCHAEEVVVVTAGTLLVVVVVVGTGTEEVDQTAH